jgi:hypothetical protein
MLPERVMGQRKGRMGQQCPLGARVRPLARAVLGRARRHAPAALGPVYVRGLLGPGDRKSVEPLVARVAPADYEQVHHFVCTSCWDPAPLERVLAEKAEALVGGPDAVLIIDDTALLKQGKRSVGVARQYAGPRARRPTARRWSRSRSPRRGAGRRRVRLFLPAEWTDDPERLPGRRRAGGAPRVPDEAGDRARGARPPAGGRGDVGLRAGGCGLRHQRRVPPGALGARAHLGRWASRASRRSTRPT